MRTTITIDAAGRLVLPKQIRDQHGLHAGSELEVEDAGTEIRLQPVELRAPLRDVHGILVFAGRFLGDPGPAVRYDRATRMRHVAGE